MVTPRTRRPRGRPRKPVEAKPCRGAGRPALSLLVDPDRYRIACLDALQSLGINSKRACAMLLASLDVGVSGGAEKRAPDGRVISTWLKAPTLAGATAASVEGRAASLREKQRRQGHSSEEANWRKAMAYCFKVALHPRDRERAKTGVFTLATVVGEGDFAQRVLWPMIDARFSR
jgi:hypothetical protein